MSLLLFLSFITEERVFKEYMLKGSFVKPQRSRASLRTSHTIVITFMLDKNGKQTKKLQTNRNSLSPLYSGKKEQVSPVFVLEAI